MDADQLYFRAMDIQDGKANGFWVPILQHLAMRGHTNAMTALAAWYADCSELGRATDPFSAAGLYRRAWRKAAVNAAQNLAMDYFNCNDMARFRLWARRAAKLGDYGCAGHIKRFETRLPHSAARKIGRHRPEAKRDEFA